MFGLKHRNRQPELMDQPGLDANAHHQALAGLNRVNLLSGTAEVLFREIRSFAAGMNGKPLRVLDVATGGGDVAIGIVKRAVKQRVPIHVDGCDISPTAVKHAQAAATAAGLSHSHFFIHDVLNQDLPSGYDIVMCSLFLHHLEERDTVQVLARMRTACSRGVLVDDLLRSAWGFVLAWSGCRLLTRSPIVHTDGPLSVRAAYTMQEISELAAQAGLEQLRFRRHWPQRFLMRWSKPECREESR